MQTGTTQTDREILGLAWWLIVAPICKLAALWGRIYEDNTEEEE